MPLSDEIKARLLRAERDVAAACEREGLSYVLIVEPKDERTGIMIMSDEDNQERSIRRIRELLAGALDRVSQSKHAVVKVHHEEHPPACISALEHWAVLRFGFQDVRTNITRPRDLTNGMWWIDIHTGGKHVVVQWSQTKGFGVSLNKGDSYGEGPDMITHSQLSVRVQIEKIITG